MWKMTSQIAPADDFCENHIKQGRWEGEVLLAAQPGWNKFGEDLLAPVCFENILAEQVSAF